MAGRGDWIEPIPRGGVWDHTLSFHEVDANGDKGDPIDISALTPKMDLRLKIDGPLIHRLTLDNGGITRPADHQLRLKMSTADTAKFPRKMLISDLPLIDGDGEATFFLRGQHEVKANVTETAEE